MKFVPADVPPFPVTSHEFEEAVAATHDATPLASEVRIFPAHCVPSMIWMVPPETVSFCHGAEVPIPTVPPERIVIFVASLGQIMSDPAIVLVIACQNTDPLETDIVL